MNPSLAITSLIAAIFVLLSGCASDPYQLHSAAMWGYEDSARNLIAKGADVNARDKDGNTPLMRAVSLGNTKVAKLLIDNGADVNAGPMDSIGCTILASAIMGGYTEIANLLISRGANVNARDKNGINTPLSWAMYKENIKIAKLLIDNGADVNARYFIGGNTHLMNAAYSGDTKVAKLLIDNGADVNAKAKGGWTPLMLAKTKEMADLLISKGADENARLSDGRTAAQICLNNIETQKKHELAQRQEKAEQQELARQRQREQAAQQQQRAANDQESSGGGGGIAGSLLSAFGAGVMNRGADMIRADNTIASRIVGDAFSNMATKVANNEPLTTSGGGKQLEGMLLKGSMNSILDKQDRVMQGLPGKSGLKSASQAYTNTVRQAVENKVQQGPQTEAYPETTGSGGSNTRSDCLNRLSGAWEHPVGGTWEFEGNKARMVLNSTNYGSAAKQITELSLFTCDGNTMKYKIVRAALINTVDPSMAYDKTPANTPNLQNWSKTHTQAYSISGNALKFGNYTYIKQ